MIVQKLYKCIKRYTLVLTHACRTTKMRAFALFRGSNKISRASL